jgi:Ner family transcriptional regulator
MPKPDEPSGAGPSAVDTHAAQDWHPADVLAALKKRGLSLTGLSKAHGYHPTAAGKALKQPWRAMETIIASTLGLTPQDIWPSRQAAGTKTSQPLTRRKRAKRSG